MTMSSSGRRRARARLVSLAVGIALAVPLAPTSALAAGGLFRPYQAITVPSEPDAVAIGDVTGDGRADVVLTTGFTNNPANDFHLLVLAQDATGGLLPPVLYATAGSYTARPGSVAIGDVNGDGRPDVAVGLDRYGIQLFPQLSDGSLGTPSLTLSADTTRIRMGHLDKSPRFEIAGIGWGSDTVTTFADTGAGLVASRTYPARHGGWDDLEVADVTGDGLDDLVVMSGQLYATPNFSVLAQLPNGTFGPAAEYAVGANTLTNGIGIADVNGDGRKDVVASYGGNQPMAFLAVFVQTLDGSLAAPVSLPSYDIPEPVEAADVNRDGRDDVITLHGGWLKAGVYRGQPGGTLGSEELYDIPYASHYSVHGLAVGDINSDGWPDVVEADYNHGLIVLRNQGGSQPTSPDAPTLTSAVPGDGRITLGWAAPARDGGSAITGYTATATPGGGSCSTTGLGCTITGLTNNVAYSVTVRAANVAGSSPASNALSATPGVAPSAPRSPATSPNLAAGVGLSWQAPASPGSSAVTAYRIYRGMTSGTETLLATVGTELSYTDDTVVNGGSYVYQVSAVNAFGEGSRSIEVAAQRGRAPSPPRSPTATAAGQGVTVKWSTPSSNGGSAITGYRIYRSTSSGTESLLATVGSTATNYLDKGVGHKIRYFYWVTALNVLGESVPSSEVSVTSR